MNINPVSIIVDQDFALRGFDPVNNASDEKLLESVRAFGVVMPLTVRLDGSDVHLVAGHRRLAAVRLLIEEGIPISTVPCQPDRNKHFSV